MISRKAIWAALLIQIPFLVGANLHRGSWLGKPNKRAWGIQNQAKLDLASAGTLGSYLLQVRGGGNYDDSDRYYGDSGNYGDDGYGQGYDARDWEQNDYQDGRDDYYGSSKPDRYDDYDDRGRSNSRGRSGGGSSALSDVTSKIKNGDRRIGGALLTLGAVFTALGVSLFFNKTLMRLGNLMFIAGVPVTIGPSRTAGYFMKPEKIRATGCLAAGVFLVFVGWPIFGIALEVFGLLNLFGNMFPMFWAIFKNLPIVSSLTSNSAGGRRQSYSYDRERDRDYRDDPYEDDRRGYSDRGYDDNDSYY